ncbi:MAG TPA: hypothetical protein VEF71_01780 [Streptosporangiaceae bacterium]|nr:hypothetical protein [Streptosporangiaceae bacterium]
MPEQEYLPPRQPGGSRGPGRYDQDPPPWASLSSVRQDRPRGFGDGPADDAPEGEPEQAPQWAGPQAGDEEPPAAPRRAPGGRAARAAARRRRRWLFMLAGLVGMAGAVTAVVLLAASGAGPAPVIPGGLITTFQPGELQQVPDACRSVPAATVQQYLPGKVDVASPLSVDGAAESACDWTIDRAPVYRLLQLSMLAYAPSGLASGNGSATFAAVDAYDSALAGMQHPPEHSAEPRATVTLLSGLGNEAFSAQQVFRRGGAVTDVATVVVRYHNVVVTATTNGLQRSNRGDYGPVSMSQLSSAALAFAQAAEATLH